jgi:hypothetical protein
LEDEKGKIGQAKEPEIPAKVIRTVPEDGSENLPTSLKEIVIVFDQPIFESLEHQLLTRILF